MSEHFILCIFSNWFNMTSHVDFNVRVSLFNDDTSLGLNFESNYLIIAFSVRFKSVSVWVTLKLILILIILVTNNQFNAAVRH